MVAAIAFHVAAIIGYRRAAYRERAAGYTTTYGDYAAVYLPGRGVTPLFRLFSISELWHLDSKSGDVLRPPGEPRNDHRLGFGI